MGFTVAEELKFPSYGVSVANTYVTIKATYQHYKRGTIVTPVPLASQPPYTVTSRFHVYAYNPANPESPTDIVPLREETISVEFETMNDNSILAIYTAIKSQHFPNNTITDNL